MNYEYDVAISYKSELRNKAIKIADYLTADGWKVFLDENERQELLSQKIHQELYDIYKNRSLMKVLLLSDSYFEGEWTALEMRASIESTKQDRKRLLIVNYAKCPLPDSICSLQYLDGTKIHEDEIAYVITERISKYLINHAKDQGNLSHKNRNIEIKKVINNHGIVTGDHAHFGNIKF